MNKGYNPVSFSPFAVPRSVEQKLRKEIARLLRIRLLQEDYTF
jgi:hypothetical protein